MQWSGEARQRRLKFLRTLARKGLPRDRAKALDTLAQAPDEDDELTQWYLWAFVQLLHAAPDGGITHGELRSFAAIYALPTTLYEFAVVIRAMQMAWRDAQRGEKTDDG